MPFVSPATVNSFVHFPSRSTKTNQEKSNQIPFTHTHTHSHGVVVFQMVFSHFHVSTIVPCFDKHIYISWKRNAPQVSLSLFDLSLDILLSFSWHPRSEALHVLFLDFLPYCRRLCRKDHLDRRPISHGEILFSPPFLPWYSFRFSFLSFRRSK